MHRCAPKVAVLVAALALISGCSSSTVEGRPSAPTSAGTVATTTPTPSTTTAAPSTTTEMPTTTTTTTATPPSTADASSFEGTVQGTYFFLSPSGKFQCGIRTRDGESSAGCQGDLPADAPKVPGSGSPEDSVAPNTIEVTGAQGARFFSAGGPKYYNFDGGTRELPYGSVLDVGGYSCSVDESAGVTCTSDSGTGFTVSNDSFRLF